MENEELERTSRRRDDKKSRVGREGRSRFSLNTIPLLFYAGLKDELASRWVFLSVNSTGIP